MRAELERDRSRDFLDRVIENIPVTVFVKDACSLRYIFDQPGRRSGSGACRASN